jgi:hypothetical protein
MDDGANILVPLEFTTQALLGAAEIEQRRGADAGGMPAKGSREGDIVTLVM